MISLTNEFNSNQAQYGQDIASYPVRLKLDVHNKSLYLTNGETLSNISLIYDGLNEFSNKTLFLGNISSGNEIPYVFVVTVLDSYGNIVNLDNAY